MVFFTVQRSYYLDLNASILINDFIWVGASYKSVGILSFITKINVAKKLDIGYSYDYPLAKSFFGKASHEVFLKYNISIFKDDGLSPRYF